MNFISTLQFLLFSFILLSVCSGQNYDTGFEFPCSSYLQSFEDGCIPNWVHVTGTTDTEGDYPVWNIQAIEGDHCAHSNAAIRNCEFPNRGESYALNYSFDPCKTYTLEYKIAFYGNHPSNVKFILANDLPNLNYGPFCSETKDMLLPIDEDYMRVISTNNFSNTTDWHTVTVSFTPDKNYNQMWVRTELENAPFGSKVHSFVDEVSITVHNPEGPPFYTKDEVGNITSSFCYGEDVTICINNTDFEWSQTLFTVYKEPAGSFFTKSGIRYDVSAGGCYNLSQFIREQGNNLFQPGFSYTIKMSVYNAECGWYDSFKKIYVDCCEEDNALFDIDLANAGPYSNLLTVTSKRDYTYYGDEQVFCLSSDGDQDGTYDGIGCWSVSSFSYVIDICTPYIIRHTVTNECGSFEETRPVFIEENCDCIITNIRCHRGAGGALSYIWEGSSDVLTYEIGVTIDDPECDCGDEKKFQFEQIIQTENNFIFFTGNPCLSVRLRPVCEDGSVGAWTEKICSDECLFIDHLNEGEQNTEVRFPEEIEENSIKLYPVPFKDQFNITLDDEYELNPNYQIIDVTGGVVLKGTIQNNSTIVNASNLKSGIYIVRIQNKSGLLYLKRIVKK